MNLNGDEERIRQLFGELSVDDQLRTPQFARVLTAVNSGTAHLRNRTRPLRFAMAVAMLDRYPAIRLTATDVDPAMRTAASSRLARFGDRTVLRQVPVNDQFRTVRAREELLLHHR